MMYLIDGCEVEVSNIIPARCSDYTVYENKIWRIVATEGCGINRAQKLEREEHKETCWIKGPIILYKVIKPTGSISI
jgi:hypothetical protein